MKNDTTTNTTTTLLNFVLAVLIIFGVICAVLSIQWTHGLRSLVPVAQDAGAKINRLNALLNDVAVYNASAKSPELNRAIQFLQPKTVTK